MHLYVLVGLPTWYSILKCTASGALDAKDQHKRMHGSIWRVFAIWLSLWEFVYLSTAWQFCCFTLKLFTWALQDSPAAFPLSFLLEHCIAVLLVSPEVFLPEHCMTVFLLFLVVFTWALHDSFPAFIFQCFSSTLHDSFPEYTTCSKLFCNYYWKFSLACWTVECLLVCRIYEWIKHYGTSNWLVFIQASRHFKFHPQWILGNQWERKEGREACNKGCKAPKMIFKVKVPFTVNWWLCWPRVCWVVWLCIA